MAQIQLDVTNIRVSYGKKQIINGCDIQLAAGTLTGILGQNGSGKTTLLKALCGLIPFHADKWQVMGKEMKNLSEKMKAVYISFLPQKQHIIYQISTIEVVIMGFYPHLSFAQVPGEKERKAAFELLCQVGLEQQAYEDYLSLSEGQKQMVMLARTLAQQAPVMLMDEPDSGLDFVRHHSLLQQVKELVQNNQRCCLMSLHDPNYAMAYCDHILILNHGRLVADFKPKESSLETVKEKLSILYPEIDILQHQKDFVMVRSACLQEKG